MALSFSSPASCPFSSNSRVRLRTGGYDSFAAGGGRGQVALGHTKEAAELTKMCPQHPGSASQGKDENWTWQHTVALWPPPSFSRVELLEG